MRISDWSSDVCSSDLLVAAFHGGDQRSLDIVANHVPAPREKLADSPAGDILTGLTRGRHALSGSVLATSPTSSFGVPAIMAAAKPTPAPTDRKSTRLNSSP